MHCIWKQDIWHAVFEKGFLFTIVWFVILKLIMLCSENELICFLIVKDVYIVPSY